MTRSICIIILLIITHKTANSQCCASSGNPIGSTVNIGLLDKHIFRIAAFYRFSSYDEYYIGDKKYSGNIGSVEKAIFNYVGLLSAYGISDRITLELETGYFINKTHFYKINDQKLTGYGLADAVISVRPRIYHNPDKQFEISCTFGSNIPFSRDLQQVNGVTLPIDLQPSTVSFGLVFQSNIIKENSFRSSSFLLLTRIEKYFETKQGYTFGNSYSNSLFFSKFFFVENQFLQGWTSVLQIRNQIRGQNSWSDNPIKATGNCSFFFIPQISLSLPHKWNFSMLVDVPVYQYFNEIQLAKKISYAISINKDFIL
ncbi:MAG: hypothetical protein A2X05_15900 [Bacteroidetes bacterium GWE2_41_25]|nr:MAG: hypothetical protein A2X03_19590 [Bacteroidetes bacterium GWA2_40_15]OFX84792.1 MAG: hypothetical protein A2X06_04395 [Bacteroidetes bacterium GWC2_40_22]OFY01445.1 MAG: hypothetical protein A2X05_15900 [Bacteroidetes bacterium GWE2_41_25]OFY57689.1 MAG: hypothetical protein A2X04_15905 [Bacteroidetes bacterium GWF2_41_9]HAM08841.1 hypothetical protein [Bacteroidales bacterium]